MKKEKENIRHTGFSHCRYSGEFHISKYNNMLCGGDLNEKREGDVKKMLSEFSCLENLNIYFPPLNHSFSFSLTILIYIIPNIIIPWHTKSGVSLYAFLYIIQKIVAKHQWNCSSWQQTRRNCVTREQNFSSSDKSFQASLNSTYNIQFSKMCSNNWSIQCLKISFLLNSIFNGFSKSCKFSIKILLSII